MPDEQHAGIGADRDGAGVGHNGVEVDLEALGQLDLAEVLADRVGAPAGLRDLGGGLGVVLWKPWSFSRSSVLALVSAGAAPCASGGRGDARQKCGDESVIASVTYPPGRP